MFLHVSVILFTGVGGSLLYCMLDTHPLPPLGTRGRHPPAQCMLGDTGNKQAVRILLQCNRVENANGEVYTQHEWVFRSKCCVLTVILDEPDFFV